MNRSFLVIQTAFLGDAVLATSLLETIHANEPDAKISLLVRKGNESLFTGHPFLNEVITWNKRSNKQINLLRTINLIRSRKFDFVINLQRFFSTGLLTTLSGAPVKIGYQKNPFSSFFTSSVHHMISEGVHETDRINSLVKGVFENNEGKPRLYPDQGSSDRISQMITEPYVVMLPASVWQTKQLPEEKWIELVKLCSENYKVVLAGSPDDKRLCERIANRSGNNNCMIVAGDLNLLESTALISGARMTYVNDSGPLHMASAVNAPVTAFFCSTITGFGFGPLSDNSKVIESGLRLRCRPCGLHGKRSCPEGHFKCGNEIVISKELLPDA